MIKFLFASFLFTGVALAENPLVDEIEKLRNSLLRNDPTRAVLTLRLADTLFDETAAISGDASRSAAEAAKLAEYRRRAITLYEEALRGGDGAYPPAQGSSRIKIEFQLAKLHSDLEQHARAIPLWKGLAAQKELTPLRREGALRLAEYAEQGTKGLESPDTYYKLALELCQGTEACSYIHYRRAWLLRNENRIDDAVTEMRRALWDTKGQIREEALRDWVSFLALVPGTGGLDKLEPLSAQLGRPQLLLDLAYGYFAAGNKVDGIRVLSYVNEKSPKLDQQVRLLEEYYGQRDWQRFRGMLRKIPTAPLAESKDKETVEAEKIIHRLAVQLDGERISQPQYGEDFRATTQLYLSLFPKSAERKKMMDGWIASEPEATKKRAKVHEWLDDKRYVIDDAERLRWYELCAMLAEASKDNAATAAELETLATLVPADSVKNREYRFRRGFALYAEKNTADSLPIFQALATVTDSWGIRSQQILLDSYAQAKNYELLLKQAGSWVDNAEIVKRAKESKALAAELESMRQIIERTRFEQAAAAGTSAEALKLFAEYCLAGKLLPKSCDNARVLAVQRKDQATLLSVLKRQGDTKALAEQYEASAYFAEAAEVQEPMLKDNAEEKSFLRVALLYELGERTGARDRVLDRLMVKIRTRSGLAGTEDLLFQTYKDANLFKPAHLALPWTSRNKARLANELEVKGQGSKLTQLLLLSSKEHAGAAWEKAVLAELEKLSEAQKKIGFYGRNGQRRFEARLAGLKKLVARSESFLPGADAETREKIAALLERAHLDLAKEILDSPIPDGLAPEIVAEVKTSLGTMAEPFTAKAADYAKIKVASKPVPAAPEPAPVTALLSRGEAMETLHSNPFSPEALSALKQLYESKGQLRLASYFEGRLRSLPGALP